MLADGQISVDEAERLLSLVDRPSAGEPNRPGMADTPRPSPKYLRVVVEPDSGGDSGSGGERVNIRVPMGLIRAGVKLAALIPTNAATSVNEALGKQGIDVDMHNLKTEDLELLVDELSDLEVDVQDGKEKVRIYVE
tara:strand:+ start:4705 stop:5115 length:411 start_codon:yes stop_codon:yes gene_type:complete